MLFNSIEFVVFLIIVFFAWWSLAKFRVLRMVFLFLASCYFYMSWNAVLIVLIMLCMVVDFWAGAQIDKHTDEKKRKFFLGISMALNLTMLGFFKYTNFFISTTNIINQWAGASVVIPYLFALLAAAGVCVMAGEQMKAAPTKLAKRLILGGALLINAGILWFFSATKMPHFAMTLNRANIILPVGISFYKFQSMSYTIDIYRRHLKPTKSFLKFATFVMFFPQLVAGPIVRATYLLPQFDEEPVFDTKAASIGLFIIIVGMIKKVIIADYIAMNLVDRVFENPALYSPLEALMGVYGYAMQIYCDFSGYSDIAIGSAMLLGFRLPDNFNVPYVASNLQDFWHRWHISLSTWLRDYLYIPLGGSREGAARTYLNVFITFFLGGLWHGAGWTFVVWGTLHGAGLALTRMGQRLIKDKNITIFQKPGWKQFFYVIGVILTFNYVCFTWLFFRGSSFQNAWAVLTKICQLFVIPKGTPLFAHFAQIIQASPNLTLMLLAMFAVGYGAHFAPRSWIKKTGEGFAALPAVAQALILAAVAMLIYQLAASGSQPFIYFQF